MKPFAHLPRQTASARIKWLVSTALIAFLALVISFPFSGSALAQDEDGQTEQAAPADDTATLSELLKGCMDKKLSAMTDLPILLFPKTENSTLENLQPILKNNYFAPPRVTEVTMVRSPQEKFLWDEIVVHMKPFLIKGMPVNSATLTFKGCEFFRKDLTEKDTFTITRVDNIILRVAAPIEAFSEFVTSESRKFGYLIPRFRASQGTVQLYGPMQFMEFKGEVDVTGVFDVNKESRDVEFQIQKVSLGKSTVPSFVVETISALVNPIFRIENFPYKLTPNKIAIESNDQELVIYGENNHFLHKYKKIEYKSDLIKQYLSK